MTHPLDLNQAIGTNLLNYLPGLFYRCLNDEHWTMTYVSKGCQLLTGYEADEVLNNNVVSYASLIYPDDVQRIENEVRSPLDEKRPFTLEYRIVTKNGAIRWVREIGNGVYCENGELICIEGYIQDNTAEKETRQFTNTIASYQNAINNGSLVSIADKEGRIVFVNDLFCQYSQYTRQELIGQDHRIINSGYHSASFFADMWKTIKAGTTWRGEIRNKAKNGFVYWVDSVISPVFNDKREIIQFLSIRNLITDKKDMMIALEKSERMLKEISASIPGVVYQFKIDANGEWSFPYMSDGAFAVLGIDPNDAYKDVRIPFSRVHPDDLEELYRSIQVAAANKASWLHRFRVRMKDGDHHWIRGHSNPKVLEDGSILWNGTMIDISESKKNETLLQEANSQISKIYGTLDHAAFWGYDFKNKKALYASEGNEILYGYSSDDLMNDSDLWLSLVHEEDKQTLDAVYDRLALGHTEINEFRVRDKNGRLKWLESRMTPTLNEVGELIRIDGIDFDINERKNAEEALRRNEKELKAAQRLARLGSWYIDHKENTITCSDEALNIMGRDPEPHVLPSGALISVIHPDDLERVGMAYRTALIERIPFESRHRFIMEDGSIKYVHAQAETEYHEDGTPAFSRGTIHDITEEMLNNERLKASEAEKILLIDELNKKYNELMQFNYIVSHNLRSPIANIIGLSNLLEIEDLDEKERRSLIQSVKISTERLDGIVKDLGMVLSARTALDTKKETVLLTEVLQSIEDTLEQQILSSGTIIHKKIHSDASSIFTVKSYFKSILFNLIANAIKYRHADRLPVLMIETEKNDEQQFLVRVTDNGIGIDLEKHGKDMFGLYKRFNNEVEGKGLGLHMVRSQVSSLNGNITVASTVGKGSCFTVTLPA